MTTIDWLGDKGRTLVDHINDERDRLVKWTDSAEDLKDLAVMALALSNAAREAAYAAADAAADRDGQCSRPWRHVEELAGEVSAGEHRADDD